MIRNVSVNQLLFSDLLVRDPVDMVNELITDKTSRRKIVLAGSRGSGKTVVLCSRENEGIGTNRVALLTRFCDSNIFGRTRDFNKEFLEHYYEVAMVRKVLDHIKNYYPDLYIAKFSETGNWIGEKELQLHGYMKDQLFGCGKLSRQFFSGEVLSEVLSKFRRATGADELTLMIDDFDWTEVRDPRVQRTLQNYFDMFEKVIITSDDQNTKKSGRIKQLEGRGFDVVDFGYSHDLSTVREIVERRFSLDEGESLSNFPVWDITAQDYEKVINATNGNINCVLDAAMLAEKKFRQNPDTFDMQKEFAVCEKVKKHIPGAKFHL